MPLATIVSASDPKRTFDGFDETRVGGFEFLRACYTDRACPETGTKIRIICSSLYRIFAIAVFLSPSIYLGELSIVVVEISGETPHLFPLIYL